MLNSIFGWFLTEGILYDLFKGEGGYGADVGGATVGRQVWVKSEKLRKGAERGAKKGSNPDARAPAAARHADKEGGGKGGGGKEFVAGEAGGGAESADLKTRVIKRSLESLHVPLLVCV